MVTNWFRRIKRKCAKSEIAAIAEDGMGRTPDSGGAVFRLILQAVKPNCRTKLLGRGSPMPLWLKARARAVSFRRGDLARTHWKKVLRSMVED
jgi:hypothetical protein